MKQNERNAENKGGKSRNGMGIRVRRISVGMRGIWVKMQKKENQGGDAGNRGRNLSITLEMT